MCTWPLACSCWWHLFKLCFRRRAPLSPIEIGLQGKTPVLLGTERDSMDLGAPRGRCSGCGAREVHPRGASCWPRGRARRLLGRTWLWSRRDLGLGASSPPSAAARSHRLHSAVPASPIRSLSFLALPFALPWSHLFTLPSLPVTPRSPSFYHSHPFCPLSPHSSPLPGSPSQRALPVEMLRTPRPGSAPRRALGAPLPPRRGRGRQVTAPSLSQ